MYKKTELFLGIDPVNNGMVSNYFRHLGGNTVSIGWTIDDYTAGQNPANFRRCYAGDDVVNNKVVSPNFNHRGGSTKSIGFLSLVPIPGGTEVLSGTGPGTNGDATTSQLFQGQSTEFFGYTMP